MTQHCIYSTALFLVLGVSLLPKAAGYQGCSPSKLPVLQGPSQSGGSCLCVLLCYTLSPAEHVPTPVGEGSVLSVLHCCLCNSLSCSFSLHVRKNYLRLKRDFCENISLAEVHGARGLGWMSIFLGVLHCNPCRVWGLRVCLTAPSLSSHVCSSPSSWRNQGGGGQRTHGVLGSFYRSKHGKRIITCQVESFKALKKILSPDLNTYLQCFVLVFVLLPHGLSISTF